MNKGLMVINRFKINVSLLGASAAVAAVLLAVAAVCPVQRTSESASATTGTATAAETELTLTTESSTAGVDLTVASTNGTFAASGDKSVKFQVKTTNATGYDLSMHAKTNTNALVNTDGTTYADGSVAQFTSISGDVAATDFAADTEAAGTSYNNKWGYSMYTGTTAPATLTYKAAPDATGTTLDTQTGATTVAYTLGVGARADYSQPVGEYSNSYVLQAVGKVINYTLSYIDNSGEATGMPSSVTSTTSSTTVNVTLSGTAPERNGYIFQGWCTASTSDETCSGTTIAAGGTYTLGINQTSTSNISTVYAMWAVASPCKPSGTTITTIGCMQDITSSNKTAVMNSMTTGTQYQLYDARDEKPYYIAKLADGKVWMTQNLDYNITGDDVTNGLTSETTDLTSYGSGAYTSSQGYSSSNGVITWKPARATIDATGGTISNWTNDYNEPYSVDPGDWYWVSSTYYASTTCNYLTTSCDKFVKSPSSSTNNEHGHVGNYYNWSTAIATNNSSNYSSSTLSNTSNNPQNSICPAGWRLPTIYGGATNTDSRNEFYVLLNNYSAYVTSGSTRDQKLTQSPLYFVRGGNVNGSTLSNSGNYGYYWSSTVYNSSSAYYLYFNSGGINPAYSNYRYNGFSVRCVLR